MVRNEVSVIMQQRKSILNAPRCNDRIDGLALVAVGTVRLDSMLITVRAAAPRKGFKVSWLTGPVGVTDGTSRALGADFASWAVSAAGWLAEAVAGVGVLGAAVFGAGVLGTGVGATGSVGAGAGGAGAGAAGAAGVRAPLVVPRTLAGSLGW